MQAGREDAKKLICGAVWVSSLNPSCIELELWLGFDNMYVSNLCVIECDKNVLICVHKNRLLDMFQICVQYNQLLDIFQICVQ